MGGKMVPYELLAVELLDEAKEARDNPSQASALALIGIGNALLEIVDQLRHLDDLGYLDRLGTMVGSLDEIAHQP